VTELAHRNNDGVDVSLYWDRGAEDLLVYVEDRRTGDHFSLSATRERALDVFYHPYAYAVDREPRSEETFATHPPERAESR
jgi:hypothetical protein